MEVVADWSARRHEVAADGDTKGERVTPTECEFIFRRKTKTVHSAAAAPFRINSIILLTRLPTARRRASHTSDRRFVIFWEHFVVSTRSRQRCAAHVGSTTSQIHLFERWNDAREDKIAVARNNIETDLHRMLYGKIEHRRRRGWSERGREGTRRTHRSNEITLSNLLSQFKLVVGVASILFLFSLLLCVHSCRSLSMNARNNQAKSSRYDDEGDHYACLLLHTIESSLAHSSLSQMVEVHFKMSCSSTRWVSLHYALHPCWRSVGPCNACTPSESPGSWLLADVMVKRSLAPFDEFEHKR